MRGLTERHALNPDADPEPEHRRLLDAYEAAALAVHNQPDVSTLLAALASLRAPINALFDAVLVMAEEPALRSARLGLIQAVAALPDGIADLTLLQGF